MYLVFGEMEDLIPDRFKGVYSVRKSDNPSLSLRYLSLSAPTDLQ